MNLTREDVSADLAGLLALPELKGIECLEDCEIVTFTLPWRRTRHDQRRRRGTFSRRTGATTPRLASRGWRR
jgi:hypothetical protein